MGGRELTLRKCPPAVLAKRSIRIGQKRRIGCTGSGMRNGNRAAVIKTTEGAASGQAMLVVSRPAMHFIGKCYY